MGSDVSGESLSWRCLTFAFACWLENSVFGTNGMVGPSRLLPLSEDSFNRSDPVLLDFEDLERLDSFDD